MLQEAFLAALNHLLASEEWARGRLRPFAGQTVRLELPPLRFYFEITPEGYSRKGNGETPATVTIAMPNASPLRLLGGLGDPSSLLALAQVTGAAGLADCIGFVMRNLRWDVESDLANVVGDIPAHRLARAGRQLVDWQRKSTWNLARNVAEYFTEESPAIASQRDVAEFGREVDALAGPLSILEKRIAALEKSSRSQLRQ